MSSASPACFQYCRQKTQKSATNFLYGSFFLNTHQKNAFYALYAFCREVDDLVDQSIPIAQAEEKLLFWKTEIQQLGKQPARHPISQALDQARQHYALKQSLLLDLLKGMQCDLSHQGFKSFDDLKTYCYYVAGTVGLLTIEIFGYQDPKTQQYAKQLGLALQLINIIRDVREDFERNRIYLPQTLLKKHHVTQQDFTMSQPSPALRNSLAELAMLARHHYQQAIAILPRVDRQAQRNGLIMANLYLKILDKIESQHYAVLSKRIRLNLFEKLFVVIQTYWSERKQR